MFHWHSQNIMAGNGFSTIRLNSLKHNRRFLFFAIFKEIRVHLATEKAVSDSIKRGAQTTNCQLLSPVVPSVVS
jgi:hypothetical protein